MVSSLDQVSTEWLSAVLKQSGALTKGGVSAYETDLGRGNWSTNAILRLHYEAGSIGDLPQSVFLKMVDVGASSSDEFFGESEVTYYAHDYLDVGMFHLFAAMTQLSRSSSAGITYCLTICRKRTLRQRRELRPSNTGWRWRKV